MYLGFIRNERKNNFIRKRGRFLLIVIIFQLSLVRIYSKEKINTKTISLVLTESWIFCQRKNGPTLLVKRLSSNSHTRSVDIRYDDLFTEMVCHASCIEALFVFNNPWCLIISCVYLPNFPPTVLSLDLITRRAGNERSKKVEKRGWSSKKTGTDKSVCYDACWWHVCRDYCSLGTLIAKVSIFHSQNKLF